MIEPITVVGGAGYIGTALVEKILTTTGSDVVVVDRLMYPGDTLVPFYKYRNRFKFIKGDIRDETIRKKAVQDAFAVVNLAALVGAPLCQQYPEEATAINLKANLALAKEAENSKVEHFIYASTCSNYGMAPEGKYMNEESQLDPVSLYAQTKVESEQALLSKEYKVPITICRFATAYGLSQRVRFDLLLHQLIRDAWTKKKIELFGASSWRPIVHVDDIARAIILMIKKNFSPKSVYNVGATKDNYTKLQLAEMVAKEFNAEIVNLKDIKDPRNYRVSFDKIDKMGFDTWNTPPETVKQMRQALESGVITNQMLNESVNMKGQ